LIMTYITDVSQRTPMRQEWTLRTTTSDMTRDLNREMTAHPLASMLIAASIGAVVGWVLTSRAPRRRRGRPGRRMETSWDSRRADWRADDSNWHAPQRETPYTPARARRSQSGRTIPPEGLSSDDEFSTDALNP